MPQNDPWRQWLGGRERQRHILPDYRPSAVLVALTQESDPRVILTVRPLDMPTHKGQIAFPGGKLEAGETPVHAALREAYEEIWLDPAEVEVLGELDDEWTPFGFHVTPVLARVPAEPQLALSAEVAQILLPRLSELRALSVITEERQLPDGRRIPIYHYHWQQHDIWGMTARVLHVLLQMGP